MSVADPTWLGILIFALSCIVYGLFLSHIDRSPIKEVGLAINIIQLFTGIGLLIAAFLIFLGSPDVLGVAEGKLSLWIATLLGFSGLFWLMVNHILSRGGNVKPLSSLFLFTGVIFAAYAFIAWRLRTASLDTTVIGLTLRGEMIDLFIFLTLVAVSAIVTFLELRGRQFFSARITDVIGRAAGGLFLVAGIDGLYLAIKYLWIIVG
jgi:hypothetical protein